MVQNPEVGSIPILLVASDIGSDIGSCIFLGIDHLNKLLSIFKSLKVACSDDLYLLKIGGVWCKIIKTLIFISTI